MNIEEAIEILERHYVLHLDVPRAELDKAVKLGIEALKLIQHQSPNRTLPGTELLPGETK